MPLVPSPVGTREREQEAARADDVRTRYPPVMQLKPVRSLWGVDEPLDTVLPKLKSIGYAAIEKSYDVNDPAAADGLVGLLKQNGLELITMGFTGGNTVAEHVASYRQYVEAGIRLGATQMTMHSGRDAFTDAEADAFYREVVEIEKDLPFVVGHETHRGRVFFNPWRTRDVLLKFPDLKLCCDFSHWVCVAERLDWDDSSGSLLQLCADRAVHVHTRVGYEEGPQVPDPSAPEYARHVDGHFDWWTVIWKAQAARGMTHCPFTPEFGPPGYLHTLPHTNVPVANLWKVCEWMKTEVQKRFRA